MATSTKAFKLRYAVSHGVLPAGMLGTLADIGTPVGLHWFGWALAGAYLAALGAFYALPRIRDAAYELLCAPDQARDTPFFFNPFAWALLAGAMVGATGGLLSYLSRDDGGFIASNVDMVREMQQTNRLLEESIEVQREIAGSVSQLKRETSDDPAKELANRGYEMSPQGIVNAIRNGDSHAVHLFADAGRSINADMLMLQHPGSREVLNPVWHVVSAADIPTAEAIRRLGVSDDARLCFADGAYGRGAERILASPDQRSAYSIACSGGRAEQAVREGWASRREIRNQMDARLASCAREARPVIEALDRSRNQRLSQLASAYISKQVMGFMEEPSVEEVVAKWAYETDLEFRQSIAGSSYSDRLVPRDLPLAVAEVCEWVVDPTHNSRTYAALDADLAGMVAALDD